MMLPSLEALTKGKTSLRTVSQNERRDRSSANYLQLAKTADTLEDEDERTKFYFDSGMQKWYKFISNLTFSTTFCDLLPEEAQIIVDHWRKQMQHYGCVDEQNLTEFNEELIREAKAKLEPLCSRLEEAVKKETEKSSVSRAFVKLSTRGPKDSKSVLTKAASMYKERLDQMKKEEGESDDAAKSKGNETEMNSNTKWRILSEEVAQASAVTDGNSALDVLLDSCRVYEDLKFAISSSTSSTRPSTATGSAIGEANQESDIAAGTQDWNVCLVARAWDPRLRPDTEFRAICWNGELTCLGQYFHPLFFPHLLEQKDKIRDDIMQFTMTKGVQDAINSIGGNCIVDFARLAPGEVVIIELNPFDGVSLGTFPASTGLFQWDNETDRKIMKGEAPFEFRVRETITPEHIFKSKFHPLWRAIIHGKQ